MSAEPYRQPTWAERREAERRAREDRARLQQAARQAKGMSPANAEALGRCLDELAAATERTRSRGRGPVDAVKFGAKEAAWRDYLARSAATLRAVGAEGRAEAEAKLRERFEEVWEGQGGDRV